MHLKWKPYIDELITSTSKSLGILYHLQKYLFNNNLKKIYHSFVKSRLQCGILLRRNASQSTLHNLNKVHNRALRYVTQLPYRTNLNKLCASAKLLKINDIYKFCTMRHMFKLFNNNDITSNMKLINKIHSHNTRRSKNLNIYISNFLTCKSSNSLTVNSIKIWSELSTVIA